MVVVVEEESAGLLAVGWLKAEWVKVGRNGKGTDWAREDRPGKEGRKEGRKEGSKEEGRKEGRKEVRKKKAGGKQTVADSFFPHWSVCMGSEWCMCSSSLP